MVMESSELTRSIRDTIVAREAARHDGHFYRLSPQLVWAVAVQKSRHGQQWYVNIGILVRSLHPEIERPREDDCEIQIRYENLLGPAPPAAAGSRLPDRRSYFTMILNLSHDMVDDAERRAAVEFMADDLASLAGSVQSIEDLRRLYADGALKSGYVARDVRDILASHS